MGLSDTAWSFIAGVLVIAILVVLVRPGSKGPDIINGVAHALAGLVAASVA